MKSCALATALFFACATSLYGTTVRATEWGKNAEGGPVALYALREGNTTVQVTTYGARIVSITTPDRNGKTGDVVLGYDSIEGYLADHRSHYGATIGRFANRIGGGHFTVDGISYSVPLNNGPNALHGGPIGFDVKTWSAQKVRNGVQMTLTSPDGDMGFPGTLQLSVTFTLERSHGKPCLRLYYLATTDKATVVNFTNHVYFNLAGDKRSSVLDDQVVINADRYTPFNSSSLPDGTFVDVANTPFDFRTAHAISAHIPVRGYDNNWILKGANGKLAMAATVTDPRSGRSVAAETTEPGLQFYTPNPPRPNAGSNPPAPSGPVAFCLETEHFPDSPNHPDFPTTVLRPGQTFRSTTVYTFGIAK